MARLRCMIVEDQALIGMALEAYLDECGFEPVGPFSTASAALASLERDAPDLALLDVMLKDGPSVALARELKQRGVPFAIYSGLRPEGQGPPEFQDAPWLEKPASRDALGKVLERLVLVTS